MRFTFTLLFCIMCLVTSAVQKDIVLNNSNQQHDHSEVYPPADMPEVYYDDVTEEIVIVADGFADYYEVDIVSQSTLLAVISTQVGGYGDTIDISSLPDDNYTIIITSSNNNVYQGQFTNY